MERKIWIGIGVLAAVLLILSFFIFLYRPAPTREQLLKKFEEFEGKSQEMKEMGYNVTEAEEFAMEARNFFEEGDYKKAEELLKEAFKALEKAKIYIPEKVKGEARVKLSQVKVAALYERVTDGIYYLNRSVDDVINLLKAIKTDFIFRGWWRWYPIPESSDEKPNFFTQDEMEEAIKIGYTYKHLQQAVSKIKEEMPDTIFCGAIPAQRLNVKERNPLTGEEFTEEVVEEMALDPSKWGFEVSKEELQKRLQRLFGLKKGYFPDITNPMYQKLLLSWAKKQIDCGVDAIWIDMLFGQARILERISGDAHHPAVRESYKAASKIVNEIHAYGYQKYGKYIYVGTWWNFVEFPYSPPDIDFVTISPSPNEIKKGCDKNMCGNKINEIKKKLANTPIFIFIDWGGDYGPLTVFSQELSKEEQQKMLKMINNFSQREGTIFIYPLHGGWMGNNAEILSYGKFKVYDSLAPEFETYETIKQLALIRSDL